MGNGLRFAWGLESKLTMMMRPLVIYDRSSLMSSKGSGKFLFLEWDQTQVLSSEVVQDSRAHAESASGSSQGSDDEAVQTLKHSMDVMYNKELAMSIAEQVGRLIKEEREGAARAVEEQSSSGRPPTYVSPFGRIQRSNSKVQFADSSDGEQSGPKR